MKLNRLLIGKFKNLKHLINSFWEIIRNKYPARKLTVIGVTGTDGKTTTCHLIYQFLKEAGKSVGIISTVVAFFNGEEMDTGLHTTTPDAKILQPLIKKMVKKKVEYLVLETTSHGIDQHRVLGCNYSLGVLTNITHEHLDYHKTFENYLKTKAKLFKKVQVAVLNKDDPSFDFIKNQTNPKAKIVTYSLKGKANLRAVKKKLLDSQSLFIVKENNKTEIALKTNLLGEHNLANILAAAAISKSLGVGWPTIKKAVNKFTGVPGRMEIIQRDPFWTIVDFAHTPNALEKTLKTIRDNFAKKNRIIAIFGCAGERDQFKRPAMAKISSQLADVSIFTAEDPRHEEVTRIIAQMIKGVKKETQAINPDKASCLPKNQKNIFIPQPDRKKAIDLGIRIAKNDDVVVIFGKGHEKSMAYGSREIPWNDIEEMQKSLQRLKQNQKK